MKGVRETKTLIALALIVAFPIFANAKDHNLKCRGTTVLQEDEAAFAADVEGEDVVYNQNGNVHEVTIGGVKLQYATGEKYEIENSDELATIREKATGNVVLSLEKIAVQKSEKRWGCKAKFVVRGIDPRNGLSIARPVPVVCEKDIKRI